MGHGCAGQDLLASANKKFCSLQNQNYVPLDSASLNSCRMRCGGFYPVYSLFNRSNEMTDSTDRSYPPTEFEAAKLQPETTPGNPQINPQGAEGSLVELTARAELIMIPGENSAEFVALLKAVIELWQPRDFMERVLMGDFMHAQWELLRLRRLVPAAFRAGQPFAVARLQGLADNFCESAFPTGRYAQALADLAIGGQTKEVLNAQTLLMHAAAFESFDKRMAVLEIRRDRAWEKLERRRSNAKIISSS
jgi:hypothetical protein